MLKNKNLPIRFENNNPQTGNILMKPIINFITAQGMSLKGQKISYFSMAEECDVLVGIEGKIDDCQTVSIDDIKTG